MKIYYCQKCGSKNNYEIEKPKMCNSCSNKIWESPKNGNPLKSTSSRIEDYSCDFDFHFEDEPRCQVQNSPEFPSFVVEGSDISIQTIGEIKETAQSQ